MHHLSEQELIEILINQLEGRTDDAELKQLNEWIAADEANKNYIEQIKKIWSVSSLPFEIPPVEDSWKKLSVQLVPKKAFHFTFKQLAIAASLLVLMAVAYLLTNNKFSNQSIQYLADHADSMQFEDGSKVIALDKVSISYPSHFKNNEREITQDKGIAFYEITKNPQRPFIIHHSIANIKVLGTSFRTNMQKDSMELIVCTGKVIVYQASDSLIAMPGDRVVFYKGQPKGKRTKNEDPNYLYLKTGLLEYNHERLSNVFKDLSLKFNQQIQCTDSSILHLQLNSKLRINYHQNKPDFEPILTTICETFQLKLSKQHQTFIIHS